MLGTKLYSLLVYAILKYIEFIISQIQNLLLNAGKKEICTIDTINFFSKKLAYTSSYFPESGYFFNKLRKYMQ